MTDGEKADALLELITIHSEKFRQSRELETKVNIAIWTFLAVACGFAFHGGFDFSTRAEIVSYAAFAILACAGHYFFWLDPIQASEDRDSKYIAACKGTLFPLMAPMVEPEYPSLVRNWKQFAVGFSAFILGAFALFISFK